MRPSPHAPAPAPAPRPAALVVAALVAASGCSSTLHVRDLPTSVVTASADGDRMMGGMVVMVGTPTHTLVVTEAEGPGQKPARWAGVDADGTVVWQAAHDCPGSLAAPQLLELGDAVLCRTASSLHRIDVATGAERWRWQPTVDGRDTAIRSAHPAGGRVAAATADGTLRVIDWRTGAEVRRLSSEGHALVGAVMTGAGPIALLSAVRPNSLPWTFVGQPIGGYSESARPVEEPLSPRWTVPYQVGPVRVSTPGDLVVGQFREGPTIAWAGDAGDLLWRDMQPHHPRVHWSGEGGAFTGRLAPGVFVIGALEPATSAVRWQRFWTMPGEPGAALHQGDQVLFIGRGGWSVHDAGDGAPLARGSFEQSEQLVSFAASSRAVTWMTSTDGLRRMHHLPMADVDRRALVAQDGEQVGTLALSDAPPWLAPGAKLVYRVVEHAGIEPRSGVPKNAREWVLTVHVEGLVEGWTYLWTTSDGRVGRRHVPVGVRERGRRHSAAYGVDEHPDQQGRSELEPRDLDHTAHFLSAAVGAELVDRRSAAVSDLAPVGHPYGGRLIVVGDAFRRVRFSPHGRTDGPRLDVPALLATSDAPKDASRYWIAPYRDWPLVLRAEHRDRTVWLEEIVWPDVSARRSGPGARSRLGDAGP